MSSPDLRPLGNGISTSGSRADQEHSKQISSLRSRLSSPLGKRRYRRFHRVNGAASWVTDSFQWLWELGRHHIDMRGLAHQSKH